jgi:membrane-associated protease RseP (regulator of RpoE activity)
MEPSMSAYILCLCCFMILSSIVVLLVHEVGHLVAARWCGIRVLRLQLGFGPELLGATDRSGTRWALGAMPIGAYVRIPDDQDPNAGTSLWRQAAICAAGPFANLLFACAIYGLSLEIFGKGAVPSTLDYDPVIFATLLSRLSLLMGLFNLLPIPPLDGWRLVLMGIEALIKRRLPARVQKVLGMAGLAVNCSVVGLFMLLVAARQ